MTDQLSIEGTAPAPAAWSGRERALASTLAGYVFPGRDGFAACSKARQAACLAAARRALAELALLASD